MDATQQTPDLSSFDFILVNSSAGKDSQAMLDYVVELATAAGVLDRVVVVHADLGRVEWSGTKDLAERQAKHYGLRFEVVRRELGDLLEQIEAREMFPDMNNRYCTSDQKRDQISKLVTALAREIGGGLKGKPAARILNCVGIRSAESPSRKAIGVERTLELAKRGNSGRRQVWDWLPIYTWSVEDVWARIRAAGTEHHRAYDLGMPRLSCVFCVFASRNALLIAGRENPELLQAYVATEQKIGHTFTAKMSIKSISDALAAGEAPGSVVTWEDC